MPRYRCKPECCYVESHHKEHGDPKPDNYKFPHIFNRNTGDYVEFNKGAAFIARFIAQELDIDIIPAILVSEHGGVVTDYVNDVDKVFKAMKPYLNPAPPRQYQAPTGTSGAGHTGFLLDFKTNLIGNIIFKG